MKRMILDIYVHDMRDHVLLEPLSARARAWLTWNLRGADWWQGSVKWGLQDLPRAMRAMQRSGLKAKVVA